MINVLFFTHFLNAGGAEKVVRRLVGYINSHDLGLIARECVVFDDPDYHNEVPDPIVMRVKSKPGTPKAIRAINVLRQIRELKKIKKEYDTDICVSFLPGADIINVLSDIGEKRIVSVRNKESFFVHNLFRKKYVKYAYDHCDRIITVSEVIRKDAVEFFGAPEERTVAILNAIEPEVEETCDERPDITDFMDSGRVIISAGRLNAQKGQDHLIRAFYDLVSDEKYRDCKLVIMGKGELMDDLKGLADSLGISDRVLLTGSVRHPEQYLKKAELFALTSYIEGIPNALLEAMKCGLACISTECGARELLAPGTDILMQTEKLDVAEFGILLPICDDNDVFESTEVSDKEAFISKAMAFLLDNDDLRQEFVRKGYEYIKSFDPDIIYGRWVDQIRDVVENG